MIDTVKRSFIKTLTWRLTGSGATFLIALLISGNLSVAGPVAILQFVTNTFLYYIHERVWNIIKWGKHV